jgi:hypothetical protein
MAYLSIQKRKRDAVFGAVAPLSAEKQIADLNSKWTCTTRKCFYDLNKTWSSRKMAA